MRPFDDIPLEEGDYSDVALMVASVREWPAEDFSRELDARVARRFAPEAADAGPRNARVRLPRWAAGPAVALVAVAVAVVMVTSGGGLQQSPQKQPLNPKLALPAAGANQREVPSHGAINGAAGSGAPQRTPGGTTGAYHSSVLTTASGAPQSSSGATGGAGSASSGADSVTNGAATLNSTVQFGPADSPVAPGAKQIRSAEISLTTANDHVDQVAREVFQVVSEAHGSVLNSQVTTATRGSGGGYASFSLSIPTSNLQTAMTQLSNLHFAALLSSSAGSQNVSNQYNNDQRQLSDAEALRTSLLKQLAAAVTTQQIDSIKAQLKLAEQQISSWQSTLGALQHRISYSNVNVQINENGLPVPVYSHHVHHSTGFTIGRAGHDALHVLVVSAGVALIALAVMIPVGLVAALLIWLWVWLRQRRREHALDSAA